MGWKRTDKYKYKYACNYQYRYEYKHIIKRNKLNSSNDFMNSHAQQTTTQNLLDNHNHA